ncbi:rod shape-determining protein [Streptomyces fradiae]|uniref:rod shape-determining protein n=1 Tax=Streptomyces fradiae TaxID=1906 RepID=UPI002941E111|nr:rod shape-determining protein [Streptomyces fradiae]WOI61652.1 rod shape-determining protein [Streptomyces fradiae]
MSGCRPAARSGPAPRPRPAAAGARRPGPGLAVELGSARTRVWAPGRGAVLDAPTVAFPAGGGVSYPVRRGAVVDPEGAARMLHRLLGHRIPPGARPLVVLAVPVLGGVEHRAAALSALRVLRPRRVLTVPAARAAALGAAADLSGPLLVVDVGAHLTEVALLAGGAVVNAYRALLGTADLDAGTTPDDLADAAADMVTDMFRADRTPRSAEALRRGILLTGGGALRPETAAGLGARLRAPVRAAPAPHTAAVRGAATTLVPDARSGPAIPDTPHAPDDPNAPDPSDTPNASDTSNASDTPNT